MRTKVDDLHNIQLIRSVKSDFFDRVHFRLEFFYYIRKSILDNNIRIFKNIGANSAMHLLTKYKKL